MANSLGTLTLNLVAQIGGFTQQMDRAASATEKSMKQIEAASNQAKLAINSMFAVVAGGLSINSLKNAADTFTELNNRLRLVTSSSDELTKAQGDIYRISQITSQSMNSTAQVYQRFAQNAKELGINQQQVADLTETVSKAVAMSGASTEAAEAALIQFGQALNSGVLRGDEFRSVMEQTPGLAKALADGLGVPIKALRTLANDGKLTTDQLIKALNNAASGVDQQFSTITKTIGQSLTNLSNAFTKYVGEADKAAGISQTLSQSILFLSDNLDMFVNAGLLVAGTRLGAFTANLASSYAVSIKSKIQSIATTKAEQAAQEQLLIARQREALALQSQAQQITLTARLREMETRGTAQHTAAIAALTAARRAETEANIRAVSANKALATAQSATASIGGAIFRTLGGVTGLGAVLGVAASAWFLFSSSTEKATESLLTNIDTIEEVKKSLAGLSYQQLLNEQVKFTEKQEEAANKAAKSLASLRKAVVGDLSLNQSQFEERIRLFDEYAAAIENASSKGEDIGFLTKNFIAQLNPSEQLRRTIVDFSTAYSDAAADGNKFGNTLKIIAQHLFSVESSAESAGEAIRNALNPQQLKGFNKLIDNLDGRIAQLRDKTGIEAVKKKLKDLNVPENSDKWNEAIKKQKTLYSLEMVRSQIKSNVKVDNDIINLKERESVLREQLSTTTKLTESQKELVKLQKQIDILNSKKSLTFDQKAILARSNEKKDQLIINAELEKEVNLRKRAREQQEYVNALNEQIDARRRDANLDVASLGMSKKQFDEYKELIAIQEDYAKKRQSLAKELGKPDGLTQEQYQAKISALRQAQNTEVAIVEDAQKRKREAEWNWINGAKSSYQEYIDEANNMAKQTESLFTNAFGNMENSLVTFVREGKLSFKSFADAILDDLARIGVRMASSAALQAVFGSAFGSLFGNYAGASNSLNGMIEYSGLFAKGGAFSGGVQAFANGGAFTNSIVNKPTLFPFAKGTGLMGEAGPEAIMPLARTADGSLGVRAIADMNSSSNTDRPQVNIVINNNGGEYQTTSTAGYEQLGADIEKMIDNRFRYNIIREKQQGGMLDPNSRRK